LLLLLLLLSSLMCREILVLTLVGFRVGIPAPTTAVSVFGFFTRNVTTNFNFLHRNFALFIFDWNGSGRGLNAKGVLIVVPTVVKPVVTHFDGFFSGSFVLVF
jgi:hypothetical protein